MPLSTCISQFHFRPQMPPAPPSTSAIYHGHMLAPSKVQVCAALAGEEGVQLVIKLQHHLVIQVPHVTPQGQLGHLPALNSLRHLHNMHTAAATRLNTFPLAYVSVANSVSVHLRANIPAASWRIMAMHTRTICVSTGWYAAYQRLLTHIAWP